MESAALNYWAARAALDWQIEMGVDECIADEPIDRYALKDTPKPEPAARAKMPAAATPPVQAAPPEIDAVAEAREAAAAAQDLTGLEAAIRAFAHCPLKEAARNCIVAGGTQGAPVMIVTDAPDRADDRAGAIFSGAKGVLFDKMLAAIGMSRETDVYIAPVLPWNPPQNRDPSRDELDMMRPFLDRHIDLAAPKLLVLMGNTPCQALLGRAGVTRMRGQWTEVAGRSALPMVSPSYLLDNPTAKRDAWADLLALKSRVREAS